MVSAQQRSVGKIERTVIIYWLNCGVLEFFLDDLLNHFFKRVKTAVTVVA